MPTAKLILLLTALLTAAGCPVLQSQDTPVDQMKVSDPATGKSYWVYVPSEYTEEYIPDRTWPLVITLQGTPGFDGPGAQIREWKALAEEKGFIVVAPPLRSVQGILPVIKSLWLKDLERDDQTILDCLRYMQAKYNIDPDGVLLTGFSAGGYPMYYTGLRHPELFSALAARACNSHQDIFEKVRVTAELRKLPVIIIRPKDGLGPIAKQSWEAFRWLRNRGCKLAEHHKIAGGHMRLPGPAWKYWQRHLPMHLRK